MKLKEYLTVLILLVTAAGVWGGRSVCTFMESSEGSLTVKTLYCDNGCCGEDEHQECCDGGLNYWMIVAFALTGLFLLVIIILVIVALLKKKNAKRARVNNSSENENSENQSRATQYRLEQPNRLEQPDRVDMSVFGASHPLPSRPPTYTHIDTIPSLPPAYAARDSQVTDEKFDPWGKSMDL